MLGYKCGKKIKYKRKKKNIMKGQLTNYSSAIGDENELARGCWCRKHSTETHTSR